MTQNIEKTLTETRRHLNKSEPGHKQTVNTLKDTQGYPKYRLDTQGHSRTLKVIQNMDQTLKDTQGYWKYRPDTQGHLRTLKVSQNIDQTLKDT